ncbi:hypothetical protein FPE01S_05_00620 [Flavihumibacter petaseus NBRC 106054]|uniref:Uncharacterized protein n=1 Tax=Flavihumibacter petaseus NBRC 106054 TaxID=1220578 RepID=A0A0E9N7P7_9BACT|nr:hypothetical protein FPE01S_05_00620 [Flavihumibacter petaseus NBRC 106054]
MPPIVQLAGCISPNPGTVITEKPLTFDSLDFKAIALKFRTNDIDIPKPHLLVGITRINL